jgi:predicted negative regulator of RcsB-dependent stress response
MGLDPEGDGLFLTAVVYRDMGLYYDAADALDGLEAANDMSADMYLLKGEILSEMGHAEEARAAFDKADAMMR